MGTPVRSARTQSPVGADLDRVGTAGFVTPNTEWQLYKSADQPSSVVDIKLNRAFFPHLQWEGLAGFLICNIRAFHNLVDIERLLAKRAQDLFPIIQQ
jgi:hypothetical protein